MYRMRAQTYIVALGLFMLVSKISSHNLKLTTIISKSFESPIFLITFSQEFPFCSLKSPNPFYLSLFCSGLRVRVTNGRKVLG